MHILLVEDCDADIRLVDEALRVHQIGGDLTVICDGSDALKHIAGMHEQPFPPDLVMVDLNLPKVDGFEVLAALREQPGGSQIPVIVISSSGAERDRRRAAALGADAYFRKPIEIEEFLKIGTVVKELLER